MCIIFYRQIICIYNLKSEYLIVLNIERESFVIGHNSINWFNMISSNKRCTCGLNNFF